MSRSKPLIRPRKPSLALVAPTGAAAAFINAGGDDDAEAPVATAPKRHSAKAPRKAKAKAATVEGWSDDFRIYARRDGEELRRLTIYLPVELQKRVAMLRAERDVGLSEAAAEAFELWVRAKR